MNDRSRHDLDETKTRTRCHTRSLATFLVIGLLACSSRDLSPLHNGVGTAEAGASSRAGSTARGGSGGGTNATAGAANPASGGNGGASTTNGSGGASTSASGGANGTTIFDTTGLVLAPANSMGPWDFNSPEETLNADWKANTGKTRIGWVPEGAAAPLGALVLEGSATLRPEVIHILSPTPAGPAAGDSVNLATYTFNVSAKAGSDSMDAQLFVVDGGYLRGNEANVTTTSTDWTTLSFRLATSSISTFAYDPTKIMELGVALTGRGTILIDRAWLVNDAAGDAGVADAGQ